MDTGLREECARLKLHLEDLGARADHELARYELLHSRMPPGFYWQLRWVAGRMLRWLESMGLRQPDPWPPGLKQIRGSARAGPLLVWAVGTDRDTLRAACRGFADLHAALPCLVPVLVTDVADFAFFSRLGWLVEYLPRLSGEGRAYDERKAGLLARLYRGAPVLPVTAGLEMERQPDTIRRWLDGNGGQAAT